MTKSIFMQTSNKAIIIAVGIALVAAFFMPWFEVFLSLSAWDIVFGEAGRMLDTPFRFIAAVIPMAGLLVIFGAAFNNGIYLLSKPLLFLLPVLTLLVIALTIYAKIGYRGASNIDFGTLTEIVGVGFWLTLIASVILPLLSLNTRASHA